MQGVRFVRMPERELIEHGGDVGHAQHEVFEAGRLLHRRRNLGGALAAPHGFIAAGMLHKDHRVAACGPMFAQVGVVLAGTAEAVAEQDDRRGFCRRGQIDTDG